MAGKKGFNVKDKESKDKALENDKHTCPKCNVEKPLSTDFPKYKACYGGYDFSQCKTCKAERKKEYWKNYYNEVQAMKVALKKYNLTEEEYIKLQSETNCQLCGEEFPDKRGKYNARNIDHCHETGKARGVLCKECNIGLGKLGDNIEGIERALKYLKENS